MLFLMPLSGRTARVKSQTSLQRQCTPTNWKPFVSTYIWSVSLGKVGFLFQIAHF